MRGKCEEMLLFVKVAIFFAKLLLHQLNETAQHGLGNVYLDGAVVAVGERKRLLDSADAENELEVDDVFAAKTDELRLGTGDVHQA